MVVMKKIKDQNTTSVINSSGARSYRVRAMSWRASGDC